MSWILTPQRQERSLTMKFQKPPLIELIAEFRWIPTDDQGQLVTNLTQLAVSSQETEAFYERFRAAIATQGYNAAERLVPNGFPYPMQQPVFRYKRTDETSTTSVFQLGVGLFSVHALPPYENWDAFKPIIATGLRTLLEVRLTNARKAFTNISLRYIDAFGPELIDGRPMRKFFEDILKLRVDLPASVTHQATDPNLIQFALQLNTPIGDGLNLALNVGRNANMSNSVVLDTTVNSSNEVAWDDSAPLEVLESAHTSIRHIFLDMTAPIHSLMQPIE